MSRTAQQQAQDLGLTGQADTSWAGFIDDECTYGLASDARHDALMALASMKGPVARLTVALALARCGGNPRKVREIVAGVAKAWPRSTDVDDMAGPLVSAALDLRAGNPAAALNDKVHARKMYQDVLARWTDADSGLPLVAQVKADYAKLQYPQAVPPSRTRHPSFTPCGFWKRIRVWHLHRLPVAGSRGRLKLWVVSCEESDMTSYGGKDFARSFRTVRNNTIQIAEEIPEDKYGFRPAPGAQSVLELLAHLVVSSEASYETHAVKKLKTFVGVDFAAWVKERTEQQARIRTKVQVLDALKADGERWAGYLEGLTDADLSEQITFPPPLDPPAKTRFEMILSTKEHEMHHRAQLMLIERLLGIVPHLTRRREAAMAQAAKH